MPCTDYKPLLARYVDGELPDDQSALVKDHLPSCESCRKTIRLLRLEDREIRAALLGLHREEKRVGPPRPLIRAAILCGILLGLSLVALNGIYGFFHGSSATDQEKAEQALAALDEGILVRAEAMGLAEFIERLTRQAQVPVLRDPDAKRPPPSSRIDLVIVQPIRLRSVLALLRELYEFEYRVEDGRILIR